MNFGTRLMLILFTSVTFLAPAALRADANIALVKAARKGNLELVKKLVDGGADVNAKDETNRRPILFAMWSRTPGTMDLLLRANANANAKARDRNGWTPLQWARMKGHGNVVALLEDKQAGKKVAPESSGCWRIF